MDHDSFPLPKVSEVALVLSELNAGLEDECDVRLQVYDDGQWAVRWGASDFDQDHLGFWGAGSLPGPDEVFDADGLAKELIEQVEEDVAMRRGA